MTSPALATSYLGIPLRHPLMASPSPATGDLDRLAALEDAGAAAVVLPSLFEEQIEHEEMELHRLAMFATDSFSEAESFFPALEDYNTGPDAYLKLLREAHERLDIPVFASLNGTTTGGWTRYARLMEEAGAQGLELNIYFVATDAGVTAAQLEDRYVDLVHEVAHEVKIPVAVKLAPSFTSLPNFANRLLGAGASGLVLFNRFFEPDIDLESLEVRPRLRLSTSDELLLPLRWAAILRPQISGSIAVTSGVHTGADAVKALLAGADVTMMASALLRHGPSRMTEVLGELETWLVDNEYESVEQLKGSMSREAVPDPQSFERANYMKTLMSFTFET